MEKKQRCPWEIGLPSECQVTLQWLEKVPFGVKHHPVERINEELDGVEMLDSSVRMGQMYPIAQWGQRHVQGSHLPEQSFWAF